MNTSDSETNEDDFSRLQTWLALPTLREQRHYLEIHLGLVAFGDQFHRSSPLTESYEQEGINLYHQALLLLSDILERGGTRAAVREAYVNAFGGLILDLPLWLQKNEGTLNALQDTQETDQTTEQYTRPVREALALAEHDPQIARETLATCTVFWRTVR